jgi:hypothetical protein
MSLEETIKRIRDEREHLEDKYASEKKSIMRAWSIRDTSIETIENILGARIRDKIRTDLKSRGFEHQPLSILHIGCTNAVALSEIKTEFGNKVMTAGINMVAVPANQPDRFYDGDFRSMPEDRKYRLIFSYEGPFKHSWHNSWRNSKPVVLLHDISGYIAKVARLLEDGGTAYLQMDWEKDENLKRYLASRHGVNIKQLSKYSYEITKDGKNVRK